MLSSECTACPAIDLRESSQRSPTTAPTMPLFDPTSKYEKYNSRCPIAQLPTEVLFNVFSKAAPREQGGWPQQLGILSKVCRAFRRCTLSRTFTTIDLVVIDEDDDHSLAPPCTRVRRLYNLIVADPAIGKYCKFLFIRLPSAKARYRKNPLILTPDYYTLAIKLLKLMPNIQSLDVTGGFGQTCTLPFFQKVLQGRNKLQALRIDASSICHGPLKAPELSFDHIWECIRDLNLDDLFVGFLRQKGAEYRWKVPKELFKTSSIKKLGLLGYGGTPQNLETLIRLPKTLHHFSFNVPELTRFEETWTLERIQKLLQSQCDSLRTLQLDELSYWPTKFSALSFQDFRSLESICLSYLHVKDFTPQEACQGLLAPNLRFVSLDFTYGNNIFERKHRDWVLEFAQGAIARRSKLNKIQILFTPPQPSNAAERDTINWQMAFAWPWDFIDEVKEAIKANIDLVYNKVRVRKEDYQAKIRGFTFG